MEVDSGAGYIAKLGREELLRRFPRRVYLHRKINGIPLGFSTLSHGSPLSIYCKTCARGKRDFLLITISLDAFARTQNEPLRGKSSLYGKNMRPSTEVSLNP